jgi:outer membrane lipoprotein
MKKLLSLSLIALLAQGCTYAVSRDMVDRADKALTFEMLQADPDAYRGKIIILGGTITNITDAKKGSTLEIIQKPLDYWGKPKRTNRTGGHFLLVTSIHLNAMLYAPDREITVAAEVAGTRNKALGELEINYPVVISRELKLWPQERKSWDKPQWIDPLNQPSGPPASPVQSTW